jgi:hypothetical protein
MSACSEGLYTSKVARKSGVASYEQGYKFLLQVTPDSTLRRGPQP